MDFHIKYRPSKLDEVVGHEAVVRSLSCFKRLPHTFLFHGPSGVGKTTISRILATLVPCDVKDIVEVDAATNTGVDDVRRLMETLPYQSFVTGKKLIIIDECHMLSKSAWNALLKILEEPPDHVYFSLCTTEFSKVPKTIVTRSHTYELHNISSDDLADLYERVLQEENYPEGEEKLLNSISSLTDIVSASQGSARQLLVYMSTCWEFSNRQQLLSIIGSTNADTKEVIDFCRILVRRSPTYKELQIFVKTIKEKKYSPETVRIQIINYLTVCLLGARKEDDFIILSNLIFILLKPIHSSATGLQELIVQLINTMEER